MHLCAEKRLQEQKEMKELVEQVMEGHKNVKQVKAKIQEYKQQIGIYIARKKWELMLNIPKLLHFSFSGPITIFTDEKVKLRERSRLYIPMNVSMWVQESAGNRQIRNSKLMVMGITLHLNRRNTSLIFATSQFPSQLKVAHIDDSTFLSNADFSACVSPYLYS